MKQTPYPDKKDLWIQSDHQGMKYWQEQQLEEQRDALAIACQGSWEAETKRWRAQQESSGFKLEAEKLEKEVSKLEEQKAILEANVATKKLERLDLSSKGKSTAEKEQELGKSKKLLEEKEQLLNKTQADLQLASNKAVEAYKAWLTLANQEKSLLKASNSEAKREAEELLYQSDEATNKLWEEVKKRYEESKMTNLEGMELVDEEESKRIQEAFEKRLASLPLDQNYPQIIKREGLRAARERIPGAYEMLLQHDLNTKKKANPLAEANQKALHYFEEEEQRLTDTEALWMGIIEAKNRKLLLEQAEAARAYHGGEPTLWNELPLEAKEHYNNAIDRQNKETQQDRKERLDLVQQQATKARKETERWRRVWRTSSKKAALEIAKEKEFILYQLKYVEAEKQKFIYCAKLTPEERKTKEDQLQAKVEEANATLKLLKTSKQYKERYYSQCELNSWAYIIPSWNQAIRYWSEAAKAQKNGEEELAALWKAAAQETEKTGKWYMAHDDHKYCRTDPPSSVLFTFDQVRGLAECIKWKIKEEEAIGKGRMEDAFFWKALWKELRQDLLIEKDGSLTEKQEVLIVGNQELTDWWKEVLQICRTHVWYESDVLHGGYLDYGDNWSCYGTGSLLIKRVESVAKAQEAKSAGNQELADWWEEAIQRYKEAADYGTKARQAFDKYKTTKKSQCWGDASKCTEKAADVLVERIALWPRIQEAADAGYEGVNYGYILAANWYECAAYQFVDTAKKYAAGYKKYAIGWSGWSDHDAQRGMQDNLERIERLRSKWNKYLKSETEKASEWAALSAEEKTATVIRLKNEARAKVDELAQSFSLSGSEPLRFNSEEIFNYWMKAIETRATGNQKLADHWTKAAETYQKALELYIEAAVKYTAKNKKEGDHLKWDASCTEKAADLFVKRAHCFSKSQEMRSSGNQELANWWSAAARSYYKAAWKAARADYNRDCLEYAADALVKSVEYLAQAGEVQVSINKVLVARLAEVAKKYQVAAAGYDQAFQMYSMTGDYPKSMKDGDNKKNTALSTEKAAEVLIKNWGLNLLKKSELGFDY